MMLNLLKFLKLAEFVQASRIFSWCCTAEAPTAIDIVNLGKRNTYHMALASGGLPIKPQGLLSLEVQRTH
ncbi:hypothetical protein M758_4G205900 [Ceratodon purpureus]|nr:hypothetical protein M758_4G205900 [Ceratodon purpureus]